MMFHRARSATLAGIILAAVLLGLAPLPAAAQQMRMKEPGQVALIRSLLPTVVNTTAYIADKSATAAMSATASAANPAPADPNTVRGSGFIIDPGGVILTNDHVIDDAYDIEVIFSDGTRAPGRILATARRIDLARVKVDTQHPLTVVHWADSDKVQIGDPVFAAGNAFDRRLVPGDVILRVQDTDVRSPQRVQAAIDTARAQHKAFVLALVLPKKEQNPEPRWMALGIRDDADRGNQSAQR